MATALDAMQYGRDPYADPYQSWIQAALTRKAAQMGYPAPQFPPAPGAPPQGQQTALPPSMMQAMLQMPPGGKPADPRLQMPPALDRPADPRLSIPGMKPADPREAMLAEAMAGRELGPDLRPQPQGVAEMMARAPVPQLPGYQPAGPVRPFRGPQIADPNTLDPSIALRPAGIPPMVSPFTPQLQGPAGPVRPGPVGQNQQPIDPRAVSQATMGRGPAVPPNPAGYFSPTDDGAPRIDDRGGFAFGTGRGDRAHKGMDFAVDPGEPVMAPIGGTIKRFGQVYPDDSRFRHAVIAGDDGNDIWMMYLDASVQKGDRVEAGQVIGTAQDVTKKWNTPGKAPMQPHIEVRVQGKDGVFIDPATLLQEATRPDLSGGEGAAAIQGQAADDQLTDLPPGSEPTYYPENMPAQPGRLAAAAAGPMVQQALAGPRPETMGVAPGATMATANPEPSDVPATMMSALGGMEGIQAMMAEARKDRQSAAFGAGMNGIAQALLAGRGLPGSLAYGLTQVPNTRGGSLEEMLALQPLYAEERASKKEAKGELEDARRRTLVEKAAAGMDPNTSALLLALPPAEGATAALKILADKGKHETKDFHNKGMIETYLIDETGKPIGEPLFSSPQFAPKDPTKPDWTLHKMPDGTERMVDKNAADYSQLAAQGATEVKTPASQVTVNQGSDIGTIPPGMQVVRDAAGNVIRLEPIVGGPVAEAQAAAEKAGQAKTEQKAEAVDVVLNNIDRALVQVEQGDFWGLVPPTGMGGAIMQNFPGSTKRDLDASLATVKAHIGFEALARMREAAASGASGLGQITLKELDFLQGLMGSLDTLTSKEQFLYTLNSIRSSYERLKQNPDLAGFFGETASGAVPAPEYQEGATAKNAAGGKLIYRNGNWEPF